MKEPVVVGYVRLSRDDDKKNYTSIENQKALIESYAKENSMNVSEFYEDDGISGYVFDRPSFSILLDKLDSGQVDVVIAKDLSRIGRNNARVLLFLDHICQSGKRLILIDDGYDTLTDSDDIIGIKSWYNERYVKDASKKIKSIIRMKQKEGTYLTHAPYGYKIANKQFVINEEQAEVIRNIFNLYLAGHGYRKIADILNKEHIPTPSAAMRGEPLHVEDSGIKVKARISTKWSDYSVKNILKNDFYTGIYRLHKREKRVIHGTDHRVPKEEQYVFENHHEPIIDKEDYKEVSKIMADRAKNDFRSKRNEDKIPLFGSTLVCKDCGAKLVFIRRKMNNRKREYYICSTYNTKGKQHCQKSHLINARELTDYFKEFLLACEPMWEEAISKVHREEYENVKLKINQQIKKLEEMEENLTEKLKGLIHLKLNDLRYDKDMNIIEETYNDIQRDISGKLMYCRSKKERLCEKLKTINDKNDNDAITEKVIANKIIDNFSLQDVESIVSKIIVNELGIPEIKLKYNFNDYPSWNIEEVLNKYENQKIETLFDLIAKEDRDYISTSYLSKKMNELGFCISKKSIIPYLNLAVAKGILIRSDEKSQLFQKVHVSYISG